MGYHRAGFEVIGVDHSPQPRYPFLCFECDALDFLKGLTQGIAVFGRYIEEFDVIHASPPCQAYSTMSKRKDHPDLYAATRRALLDTNKPWIIENVIGAPYKYGVILCGSMFDMVVRRHRNFETSWLILHALQCDHAKQGRPVTVTGYGGGQPRPHSYKGIKSEWPTYMQMPWATPEECTQAVPPAYTEWIGRRLMEQL